MPSLPTQPESGFGSRLQLSHISILHVKSAIRVPTIEALTNNDDQRNSDLLQVDGSCR